MSNVASTLLPFLATMSKQRSTLLPKTAKMNFALKFRPFDKVERCFDNVAQNDNIVDNVASTLLLVWTGLNDLASVRLSRRLDHREKGMWCGQRTFRPGNKKNRHSCFLLGGQGTYQWRLLDLTVGKIFRLRALSKFPCKNLQRMLQQSQSQSHNHNMKLV